MDVIMFLLRFFYITFLLYKYYNEDFQMVMGVKVFMALEVLVVTVERILKKYS